MDSARWTALGIAVAVIAVIVAALALIVMPGASNQYGSHAAVYNGTIEAAALLRVPVTGIYPGGSARGLYTAIKNPLTDDPDAVQRGMKDFSAFNCSGCHAPNGGGGMGPSLSNDRWIYRSSPANIYLSIVQGRGAGMPAFGAMLPDRTVWELVAYIKSISQKPGSNFGTTISAASQSPQAEQVPAEQIHTATPWNFTQPTPENGQRPGG